MKVHFIWVLKRATTSWGNAYLNTDDDSEHGVKTGHIVEILHFSPCFHVKYESSPCTSCGHALWSDCSIEALSVWCFHWCPEDSAAIHPTLRNICAEGRDEQWVREWKKLGNRKKSLLWASNICITCERSQNKAIYLSSCELKSFRTLIFYLILSWFCWSPYLLE